MLFIELKRPDDPIGRLPIVVEWHIGEKLPSTLFDKMENGGYKPTLVQADGDELEWLGRNFTGLPRAQPVMNPVQRWRGDFAAFIFDHLPKKFGDGNAD